MNRPYPPPRAYRPICTTANFRRARSGPRANNSKSAAPNAPPASTSFRRSWAGASSLIIFCTFFRRFPKRPSKGALRASPGGITGLCGEPGSAGEPVIRSWTRVCASCGRPAACTIACAWWWPRFYANTCLSTGESAHSGFGIRWWTPTWPAMRAVGSGSPAAARMRRPTSGFSTR